MAYFYGWLGVYVHKRGRVIRRSILGADMGGDLFVGERREVCEAVLGCVLGFSVWQDISD